MKYKYEQERELLETILSLKDDPVGFAQFVYPWGMAGTPLAGTTCLRPWQLEELEALGAHILAARAAHDADLPYDIFRAAWSSGRGPGKSAVLGIIAHWLVSCHFGAKTTVAANTETQLRTRTFPEFARWINMSANAHWWVIDGMKVTPAPWLAEWVGKPVAEGGWSIDPKHWTIEGQTWSEENPSAFAGTHNAYGLAVLFDEASGIPAAVWDTADGFFTDRTVYRMFVTASQMRENQGRFYDLFYDEKLGAGWRKRKLSVRDMPGVDRQWVKSFIERHGETSDQVRVEIDGDAPKTSQKQFIPAENVRLAQANVVHWSREDALVLGVDPAPRGRTLLRFRQGANARDCCGPQTRTELYGKDNVEIAGKVIDLDRTFLPDEICVDFGMGTGVIDILKRHKLHGKLVEVKFGGSPEDKEGEAGSLGCELWGKVRDWLPRGMIEASESLFKEFTDRGWKWSGREEGKKVLESKDDLQRRGVASPDDADALACTFGGTAKVRRVRTNEPRKTIICDGV